MVTSCFPLWTELRGLIVQAGISDTDYGKSELDVVELMIIELDEHDPGSMSFRYPVDRGLVYATHVGEFCWR